MLEKEIKILEVNREVIVKKLLGFWAEKIFEGFIHDIYYDFLDDDTHKLEANNRMFRLRKKGEEHIYTIKRKRKKYQKKEGIHAKDEHETAITNIESFAKVLEKYGMKKVREKKKQRVSYRVGHVEFDFDIYEWIPEVLEIEGQSWEIIQEWITKLGLQDHETLIGGSRKIFKKYNIPYTYHE